MEPVPESKPLDEFNSSPAPSSYCVMHQPPSPMVDSSTTGRRSWEAVTSNPAWSSPLSQPYRPRTASPLSAAHSRSRSTSSYIAPPMIRTKSMPGVGGSGNLLLSPRACPTSPSGNALARVRPPRKPADEVFPTSPVRTSVLIRDRPPMERSVSLTSAPTTAARAAGHRAISPLRQYASASLMAIASSSSSLASSPMLRYAEPTSTNSWSYASSYPSVPTTPTSLRSRSPSISSLETIPDTPAAEEAAMEAERIAQLKKSTDPTDSESSAISRSGSEIANSRGRAIGFGSRDKRKRWSVCGAERRGDIDLETIWED